MSENKSGAIVNYHAVQCSAGPGVPMTAILRSLCCCQFPPAVYSCSSSSCLFLNHFHSITSLQSSPAIVAPRRPSSLGEYICRVAYYCRTSFSAALFCCVSAVLSPLRFLRVQLLAGSRLFSLVTAGTPRPSPSPRSPPRPSWRSQCSHHRSFLLCSASVGQNMCAKKC